MTPAPEYTLLWAATVQGKSGRGRNGGALVVIEVEYGHLIVVTVATPSACGRAGDRRAFTFRIKSGTGSGSRSTPFLSTRCFAVS